MSLAGNGYANGTGNGHSVGNGDLSSTESSDSDSSDQEDVDLEPPLPLVELKPFDDQEVVLLALTARVFRYVRENGEWRERGRGMVRLLHHRVQNRVRLVMHREKTLKLCANHYVQEYMRAHYGSRDTFIWAVYTDYADEIITQRLFAIKFRKRRDARLWLVRFCEALDIVQYKEH